MLRLIGTGTTDSNGVATCNYAGKGNGLIDVVAKCREVESNQIEVTDCTFYDKGLSGDGNHNTNWTNYNSNFTVTYSDGYTTLTPTQNNSNNRYSVPTASVPSQPYVVEFKKYGTSASGEYILLSGQGIQFSTSWSALTTATNIKFTIENNKITCEHDGVIESSKTTISNPSDVIRFQINNNTGSIKFSDFKIYPI